MTIHTATIHREKQYLYSFSALLLVLVVVYMYIVSATIMHVVVRKDVTHQLVSLQSEIAILEAAYIDEQHALSSELASMHGFEPVQKKIFIKRIPDTLVLAPINE